MLGWDGELRQARRIVQAMFKGVAGNELDDGEGWRVTSKMAETGTGFFGSGTPPECFRTS